MRYIRAKDRNGIIHLGVMEKESSVYFLDEFFPELKDKTLVDFFCMVNGDVNLAKKLISNKTGQSHPLDGLRLCSPYEQPVHDILCVGLNYREHLEETMEHMAGVISEQTSQTVYFGKRANRILGPEEQVHGRSDLDEKIDYEVELAVLIGREGKNISEAEAEEYIFGYSVFNDFSSRTLQTNHGQWLIGKSLDDYSCMGPVIVDRQELSMPLELNIKSYVNGELRQNSNTKNMIKKIPALIAELSRGITLVPGDIIATGTPSGVGMGFEPPRFLKKGDKVSCEIEKIGTLTNYIV